MILRFMLLLTGMLLFGPFSAAASESNATTARVELVITVSGLEKTVAAIEQSSRQIALLTAHLSDKQEFTPQDRETVMALTAALNRNADAVNRVATLFPEQMEKAVSGVNGMLDTAKVNVQEVVKSSKTELVDPTLSRIESRLFILFVIVAALLFGLLWFGLWKLKGIVATGSETVENIMNTVQSLERVVEKAVAADGQETKGEKG